MTVPDGAVVIGKCTQAGFVAWLFDGNGVCIALVAVVWLRRQLGAKT